MAHQWRGLIEEYRDRLPVTDKTPNVTLLEGGTPLVYACNLSERIGAQVWLKVEGANPTGSFKDRGMTAAVSEALGRGAKTVICASTGNTSAAAAAYARRGGMLAFVLIKILQPAFFARSPRLIGAPSSTSAVSRRPPISID